MACALNAGVTYCVIDDNVVFLNAGSNRYDLLPAPHGREFCRLLAGGVPSGQSERILERLDSAGLVDRDGEDTGREPAPDNGLRLVTGDLADERIEKPPLGLIVAAVAVEVQWRRALRRRSLLQLVGRIADMKRHNGPASPNDVSGRLGSLTAAFARSALLLGMSDRCLPRSLAYADLCLRSATEVDLIFGVKLFPFQAHCWVQREDTVLNDSLESVRPYTPILRV
jgi:hypothetical protein